MDSIKISIELADKAAQKAMQGLTDNSEKTQAAFEKLKKSGKSTFDEITIGIGKSLGVYDIFKGNVAANLVVKAFEEVAAAASKLFDILITDSITAASESEAAFNSLSVALAQGGNLTDGALKSFKDFAEQIQKTTAVEDDLVVKNAALIASMTNLDNQGIQRATLAAIELSQALGKDVQSTTEAIAKAANGNSSALKKMGVDFEEAGTKTGTFNNALEAIEAKLGGSAASKLNTFAGAVAQTKNVFGDLQEEIGNLIITNPAVIAAINQVATIFTTLKGSIEANNGSLTLLVGETFVALIRGATGVLHAFDYLVRGTRIAFNLVVEIVEAAVALIAYPLSFISEEFEKVFNEAITNGREAGRVVEESLVGGPLEGAVAKLKEVGDAAEAGLGKIGTGAETAAPKVTNLTKKTKELTDEQERQRKVLNDYVNDLAKKNQSVQTGYDQELSMLKSFYEEKEATESESEQVNFDAKYEREMEYFAARQSLLDEKLAEEQLRIDESTVSEETKKQASLQLEAQYLADKEKLNADYSKRVKKIKDDEDAHDKDLYQSRKETLGALTQLTRSKNREMFEIGKAATIAQIGINTYEGAIKAYNSLAGIPYVGPFLGAAAAAAITAFGLEQASNASNTSLQFAQGGIVPGTSYSGDNVAASVNSGEMILNRQQQTELFRVAKGESSGGITRTEIQELISAAFSQPIVIGIDGKEIFNVTRQQLASGRAF